MFKCLICGLDNPSEKARFCSTCGPDSPAKDWSSEDIDQPQRVTQYVSILGEFYFDAQDSAAVEKFSLRIRERLKVSFDTHAKVLSTLAKQKQDIAHLSNFRFEFNENVIDAFAGHDTFLNFRYTNLSEEDLFKVSLFWDDPDTTERIDLKAETKSLVKPLTSITIGASAVFERIGVKELSDLQITITDQFNESATFRAEPFSFKVGNHNQKITQNISTHNQISIEGRGVVDASGMGADKASTHSIANNQPSWKEISFSYLPKANTAQDYASVAQTNVVVVQPEQKQVKTLQSVVFTDIEFNTDNLDSVISAAEKGNADAQNCLGEMYCLGEDVAEDNEKAAHWFLSAAEQGNADGQDNLGYMYQNGLGVAKDDEKAVHWYRLAAEQGLANAQNNIGFMYHNGLGVAKNNEKAAKWFRLAAEQGDPGGQHNLGDMYQKGLGVSKDDEMAAHWFRLAGEQGKADSQNNLGVFYHNGIGVAKDNEKAVHWYRLAAEQGDAHGQFNLAFMYQSGLGVAKDDEKAAYWYRLAAEQGDADSQHNLGLMYLNGLGVAKNNEKAIHWLSLAAEQGLESAASELKELDSHETVTVEGNKIQKRFYCPYCGKDNPSKTLFCSECGKKINSADSGDPLQISSNAPTQPPIDGYGSWDYGNYTYTGMFKGGQWNGSGELIWSGKDVGHRYVGNFVNGQRTGQGTHFFPSGVTQVGTFVDGVYQEPLVQIDDADKDEHLSWNNGTSYLGKVKHGKAEGFGTMTFANGDSMYGIFVNGILNDETAHYDFADGGTYDGPMVNGIFSGHGTRTFGGEYVGHSYTGYFENGYFNGQGTYYFPDGSTNVGTFKDGTFVPPKSAKQDYVYAGETSNGIPHGLGKMTWNNGDVYKGDFVNGVRHGLGEYTYANKTQLTGRFENNVFIKNASFTESVKIGYKTGSL